ncbi:MAG: ribonuclease R, partial [Planctomycetales bacterium]
MESEQLEQAVLNYVLKPDYHPVKPKVIAKNLNLGEEDAKLVRRAVKRLVRQGRLSFGNKHLVRPPRVAEGERVSGLFRRVRSNDGWIRPEVPANESKPAPDVFIPTEFTSDAATGDVVVAEVTRRGHGRRGTQGRVLHVVKRKTETFVGTYRRHNDVGIVRIDGTQFSQPVQIADVGAKRPRAEDKVVVEILRFPTPTARGEAVLVQVLGPQGAPGVDTPTVLRQHAIEEEFPEDALSDAREQARMFSEESFADRLDLTEKTIVTIDPVDARDFDDAISLTREDNGHWRLGVHIADVSHFVQPGSALDREALERATSVYLPDHVIPMLPEIISNGLASLQPDRVRCALSAFLHFNPEGVRTETQWELTTIRSKRRFSYEEVDAFLADPAEWKTKLSPDVHGLLGDMRDLARILRRRRKEQGTIELSLEEVKVELNDEGRVVGAKAVENTESHHIIEEFMLAANEAVALRLADIGVPFLRRVHSPPQATSLASLRVFLEDLGLKGDNLQDRFALQKLLNETADSPLRHAVHYAVLRSFRRASYRPEEDGHFALGMDCYCHFTSPIRRYPDLMIHRLIRDLVSGRKPNIEFARLMELGNHCSAREKRAEEAERELIRLKLLYYFRDRVGEEMDAVITSVESFGMFISALAIPVEGFLSPDSLPSDDYRFDRDGNRHVGRKTGAVYRLGDRLRVAVARVNMSRRELDFRAVGPPISVPIPSKISKSKS